MKLNTFLLLAVFSAGSYILGHRVAVKQCLKAVDIELEDLRKGVEDIFETVERKE